MSRKIGYKLDVYHDNDDDDDNDSHELYSNYRILHELINVSIDRNIQCNKRGWRGSNSAKMYPLIFMSHIQTTSIQFV